MSDERTSKPKTKLSRGRDVKNRKFYLLKVEPETWFRMRKVDFVGLFMEGAIPTPLLSVVEDFQEMRKVWATGNLQAAIAEMNPERRMMFSEIMRRVAHRAIVEPGTTFSKQESIANPDLIWLGGLSDVEGDDPNKEESGDLGFTALMKIWRSVMGEAGVEVLPYDEAEIFREGESESVAPPVLDGSGVRTEAVVVDSHAGDQAAPREREVAISG